MLGAVAGGVVEDGGAAGALEDVSAGGGDGSCGVGGGGCSADLRTCKNVLSTVTLNHIY